MPEIAADKVRRDHMRRNSLFAGLWLATLSAAGESEKASRSLVAVGGGRRLQLAMVGEGREPAVCSHGSSGIVFEGVLYNRGELTESLGGSGSDSGNEDAAVVLRAFERWGEDALERLKGIFAFCIWDGRNERLLAARDRVGIYPLFYCQDGDRLHFSTTTDAFAAPAGPGLAVDRTVIGSLIARQQLELEETFYRGIRRVPPGHALSKDGSGVRVWRHWCLPAVGAGAEWVREDELGQFGELLDQAVGRALAQGPTGIFLSGGLDSVSVAAAATERSLVQGLPAPQALSLLFPGEVSEEGVQRGVAEQLGIDQTFLELQQAAGPGGLMAAGLRLSATNSAPLQNVWLPAYLNLGLEGRRRGCEVILTGGGGDEWLTVSPLVSADMIRSLDFGGLVRYIAALERSLDRPRLALWRNVVWNNGLRPLASIVYQQLVNGVAPGVRRRRLERRLARRLSSRQPWLAPDPELRRSLDLRAEERFQKSMKRPAGPGAGGFYFGEMRYSLEHPLFAVDMEEIFESGRRMGMMQFDIYWDADLIEFLYRVPPHLLNSDGRSKGLVRKDLARRFPGLGFDRQKKLLSRDFFSNLLLNEGEAAWKALGGAQALAGLGIVEPALLDAYVGNVFAQRDERRVDDVWRILSLESWVRPRT
ncbi:MAG: asparagine synthase-related protein [Trueperaceae bacterium]